MTQKAEKANLIRSTEVEVEEEQVECFMTRRACLWDYFLSFFSLSNSGSSVPATLLFSPHFPLASAHK